MGQMNRMGGGCRQILPKNRERTDECWKITWSKVGGYFKGSVCMCAVEYSQRTERRAVLK